MIKTFHGTKSGEFEFEGYVRTSFLMRDVSSTSHSRKLSIVPVSDISITLEHLLTEYRAKRFPLRRFADHTHFRPSNTWSHKDAEEANHATP